MTFQELQSPLKLALSPFLLHAIMSTKEYGPLEIGYKILCNFQDHLSLHQGFISKSKYLYIFCWAGN